MRRFVGCVVLVGCADGSGSSDLGFSTTGWDDGWVSLEDEVIELVNARRSVGGTCGTDSFPPTPPLVRDDLLRGLARDYSRWMAEEQFFDHVAPDGSDPFDRMDAAGFRGALPWGENIAAGYPTADAVFDGWMSSPGHCANMLEPTFGAIGVGYYEHPGDPSRAVHYWTQEFAGSAQP